jgi:myo-inositol-1(or 4)-monophosphatase
MTLDQRHIDYRRFGSAAIALSEVAAGRIEGYFEVQLNSWDCMAGMLLIEEAGGWCTPYNSQEFIENGGMVLGCNASLAGHLKELLDDIAAGRL